MDTYSVAVSLHSNILAQSDWLKLSYNEYPMIQTCNLRIGAAPHPQQQPEKKQSSSEDMPVQLQDPNLVSGLPAIKDRDHDLEDASRKSEATASAHGQ